MLNIAIIDYPNSLQSAVYGLQEMFEMANGVCQSQQLVERFKCDKLTCQQLSTLPAFDAIIIGPSNNSEFYLSPDPNLLEWITVQHQQGAIISSACAGTFIVAATGLLTHKQATTHWGLANEFKLRYRQIDLTIEKILVNSIDVITAGGMMSWLDLGLELVGQLTQPSVMRQLGKQLVVDTGLREQRYYQQFSPILNHGDGIVLKAQHRLQHDLAQSISMAALAAALHLGERTLLRRFVKATQLTPMQYLQHLRVQRACDLLETTQDSFESIAYRVGYHDVSGCRKLFVRIMGLTPSAFRQRFVG